MLRSYWLLALLAASAVLGTAGAALAAQGGSVTYFPNGLSLSTIGDSATSTIDEDDLYVKGLVEIDGDVLLGDSSGDTITIAGTPTFSAAVSFSGSVTLGDASADVVTVNADTVTLTSGSIITCESIKAVDGDGLMLYGYAGDADLLQVYDASTERFAVTTSTGAAAVVLTLTDATGSDTLTYDNGVFTFSDDLDAAGPVTGDSFTADANGDMVVSGTGAFKGGYVEAADGTTVITLTNSTALATFAGVIDVSDVELATVSARDGTTAITLTDSTALATFGGSITMATGKVLTAETIAAVDADGVTIKGYNSDADLLQVADVSTERWAITTSASADSVIETYTDKDGSDTLTYDAGVFTFSDDLDVAGPVTGDSFTADAGGDVAVSGAGALMGAHIEASDGTAAVDIADSTAALTIKGAATSFDNVACTVGLGTASSTTGSQLSLFDGGSDNKPGSVLLFDDAGNDWALFLRTGGKLAIHTAYPTDDDADGNTILTYADNVALETDSIPYAGATTPEGTFWTTDGSAPVTDVAVMGSGSTAANDALYVFKNGKWRTITLAD